MAWYTLLFTIVITLFVVKLIFSWCFGDLEMDVDFDGVDDFDTSSAFSFKGLLHFLVGASSYLFLRSNMNDITKIDGIAQFGIVDYIFAIIVGIILVFIMIFGYRLAIKASHSSKSPDECINNSKGIIYLNLGDGKYSVEAHTVSGTINVTAYSGNINLSPGDEVTLIKDEDKIYIN